MSDDIHKTETAALAEQFKRMHEFETVQLAPLDGQRALIGVVPEGKRVVDLSEHLDRQLAKPIRRKGTAHLQDVESLILHVNRFKNAHTVLFADQSKKSEPKVTGVIDYHPSGENIADTAWLTHRSVYAPALSEEWKAWTEKNGKVMLQPDFAAFLEDRITDVVVAEESGKLAEYATKVQGKYAIPSELIELSRGLTVNVGSTVKNASTLQSGEISISYEEVHRDGAGQPIRVPSLFQIAVPVFYAGQMYRLAARLRYRISGPAISWSYELVRPDLAFDDAFNGIVRRVHDGTGLPVLLGSPEV